MILDPIELTHKDNYKLMIGSIVPRPIAFVSTVSRAGISNLAPFSFFNGVCSNPPTVAFAPVRRSSDGKQKDTLVNIRETGEFVINIPGEDILTELVETAREFPPEINEFEAAGLTPIPSLKIGAPRVDEAKISMECTLQQIIEIGDGSAGSGFLVLGTIVTYHIADEIYDQGRILLEKLRPVGRLAGNGYCRVTDTFEKVRNK
ncbi:MAG: flavin reductase family protein [Fidelibacterota bacterium]